MGFLARPVPQYRPSIFTNGYNLIDLIRYKRCRNNICSMVLRPGFAAQCIQRCTPIFRVPDTRRIILAGRNNVSAVFLRAESSKKNGAIMSSKDRLSVFVCWFSCEFLDLCRWIRVDALNDRLTTD